MKFVDTQTHPAEILQERDLDNVLCDILTFLSYESDHLAQENISLRTGADKIMACI